MKAKQIHIARLRKLRGFAKRNTSEIVRVVELFKDRKVERFVTARTSINDLVSGGRVKQQKSNGKWTFMLTNMCPQRISTLPERSLRSIAAPKALSCLGGSGMGLLKLVVTTWTC